MKETNFIDSAEATISRKYKKILNSLLNISYNDSCIFANINNRNLFDVHKKFGPTFFNHLIKSANFSLSLNEMDDLELLDDLQKVQTKDDVTILFKKYNETIAPEIQTKLNKVQNEQDLAKIVEQIQKNIQIKRQKNAFKWKLLINDANKMNEQSNLWPIHLGFIYLTLKIDNKIVQAPLFLKEVNIKIKNSRVYLVSVGDLKINEKLIYFLESNNYVFDVDFDFSKLSIQELFNRLKNAWSQNLKLPDSIEGDLPNFKWEEIQNEVIQFWPGISLGFFEPTGGHLRKIMTKILEENALDEILEVEFDKNIYKKTIQETIKKKNFGFYKIVHSNLSQDKAVVSALNQNTIIWGPPGTGKSQTITNILTNILVFGKTALVVSQKRAALEVLKNRMKSLELFCLFILNDREMNKNNFYEPLKSYITYLENFDQEAREENIKIIDDQEKQMMKLINLIMTNEKAKTNLWAYNELVYKNQYNEKIFQDILELDPSLKYDFWELKKNKPYEIGTFLARNNNYHKPTLFGLLLPKNIKSAATIIKKRLYYLNLNLDFFVSKQKELDLELIKKIHELNQFKIDNDSNRVSDHHKLKLMITKMIFNKIKNFDEQMKLKYNQFALDVRSAHLDPILFIKKHADIIKVIYPVIITTPETDLQSWTKREFDYALLDESSQIYLEKGLPILYLAKIKILAGDDQQMQPSRWFAPKENEAENPFGNIESLLDYAIAKGTYAVLLDKNYRSTYASLMKFNSQVFYHGELDVVDVCSHEKEEPIEVINADGVWENSQNVAELDLMIEQAQKNLDAYKKIILLCFNVSQQNALEAKILESYPELEHAITNQKLLVRNIENIQGDEADLLIASVAYDKNTKLHATYVAKPGGKNALNVAISRAKTKMIIIKSIYSNEIQNPNQSPDISVFKEWLRFLDLSEEDKKNYIWNQAPDHQRHINHTTTEIQLDDMAYKLIEQVQQDLSLEISNFNENVEIITNYSIGSIKIPIALIDKKNQNFIGGIYFDSFNYFKSYDQYLLDKDIESFFKMKKYEIIRINFLNWPNNRLALINLVKKYFYQSHAIE